MARRNALDKFAKGTYGLGGEALDFTYYDTETLVSTTSTSRLFTAGLGQGSPAKTLDKTNLPTSGVMPQGQNLIVNAIKVWYIGTSSKTATTFLVEWYKTLGNTTVEVLIPGKDNLGQWTLIELLGACTAFDVTGSTSVNTSIIMPTYKGIYPLNKPIILAAQTTFEVKVTHQTAPSSQLDSDMIRIGLNGILRRAS